MTAPLTYMLAMLILAQASIALVIALVRGVQVLRVLRREPRRIRWGDAEAGCVSLRNVALPLGLGLLGLIIGMAIPKLVLLVAG